MIKEHERVVLTTSVPDAALEAGDVGVRTWGAAIDINNLSITRGDQPEPLYDGKNFAPPERALASLAIALFNQLVEGAWRDHISYALTREEVAGGLLARWRRIRSS